MNKNKNARSYKALAAILTGGIKDPLGASIKEADTLGKTTFAAAEVIERAADRLERSIATWRILGEHLSSAYVEITAHERTLKAEQDARAPKPEPKKTTKRAKTATPSAAEPKTYYVIELVGEERCYYGPATHSECLSVINDPRMAGRSIDLTCHTAESLKGEAVYLLPTIWLG